MDLTATTTVRRPRPEVYGFWHRFETLPRSWPTSTKPAPAATAAVTGRRPPRSAGPSSGTPRPTRTSPTRSGWHSVGQAEVPNRGKVFFVPAPDGVRTEVTVIMACGLPGGELGKAVATYFGE